MFRKSMFTLAAAAAFAIGAAAFVPTPAAAHGWSGHHHHRSHGPSFGFRFYGGPYYAYASCWRTRYVATRWGTVRRVLVNVCR
jgi:hypothetical protein